MKLTYRDKILLIVIALIVIWAAGIALVVKPKIDDVSAAQTELETVQANYEKAQQDLVAAEGVKTQCNELLKQAQEYAGNFYSVPKSFEAEEILLTLLQNDSNPIDIKNMSITGPSAAALTPYTVQSTEVTIPIIDAADIGGTNQQVQNNVNAAVSSQTVGCYTYTVSYTANRDDLLSFIDKIPSSNNKASLVVTSLSIDDYNAAEYNGSLSFSLYFVKELVGDNIDEVLEAGADTNAVEAAE